ncbi:MAG TPA: phosphoenolpyruvate--protein phosphotransferase [Chthoniobacterales bacterium]
MTSTDSPALQLNFDDVRLHASARNKEDAIAKVAEILTQNGCIHPDYASSMLARERQANTFLGNGIAIPHGKPENRDLILRTGVAVLQLTEGVEWNAGQVVRVVVGIAAKSDEHLTILAALTDVLDDPARAERLAVTDDPEDIIAALQGGAPTAEAAPVETIAGALTSDVTVVGKHGLHARPASVLAEVAARFQSEQRVHFKGKTANAKAMASLLKLGANGGANIRLEVSGPDAAEALVALEEAIASGLGDGDEPEPTPAAVPVRGWTPVSKLNSVVGMTACPGLAVGPVFRFAGSDIVVEDKSGDGASEEAAFANAITAASQQLDELYQTFSTRAGKADAAIFRAHLGLVQDPEVRDEVHTLINAGHSAAWAWQDSVKKRVAEFADIEDERLAARAADWHDVGQRVLRVLTGRDQAAITLPDDPIILLAEDLAPSETARLDPSRILGVCTALGGPTSHTAILARSLDIPALVGMGKSLDELQNGAVTILDASSGRLYLEPADADLQSAKDFQKELDALRETEQDARFQPAVLTDGHRVEVVANIGKPEDAAAAVEAGAEGVGLMRTEFLFLGRDSAPNEEEQFEAYSTMIKALRGLPLIIRTLDIGGDKAVPYIAVPKEENPFLGVRGIRLCLAQPEIFLPQLRAIYRATAFGPVKIMFPMIATLEDLRAAKELAERVRQEINVPPVEIGIMVEVPSAALMAEELAEEADFFSIGTNDLTQYALAMDRLHASLGKYVDGLHPAVLRLISQTVRAAKSKGKWVGVCGGIAGEPLGAAILTGIGVKELSASMPAIPGIKAALRRLSLPQAEALAKSALAAATTNEVRQLTLP